jgi:fatty acid desaturase
MLEPILKPGDQKILGPHGAGQPSPRNAAVRILVLMTAIALVAVCAIYFGYLWGGLILLLFATLISFIVLKEPVSEWRMTRRMKKRHSTAASPK